MLSRVTGLLRDILMTSAFGASLAMDAFLVAFRLPNLFRDMMAEGALGNAFTKVYTSAAHDSQRRADELLARTLLIAVLASSAFCAISIIFAGEFVQIATIFKNYGKQDREFSQNAIQLTRILFPFLGLAIVNAVFLGVLHQQGKFFFSALVPIFTNVGFILGVLVAPDLISKNWSSLMRVDHQAFALSVGVLVGAFSGLIGQLLYLKRMGRFILIWQGPWIDQDLRNILRLMVPAMIAAMSGPINVVINTNFATSLGTGAVLYLNNAFRILQLPVGVFGVAVGIVALPALTRSLSQPGDDVDKPAKIFLESLDLVIWLMVPCCIFVMLNADEIISLLFQRGRFGAEDVALTAGALTAYSIGMVGYGIMKLLHSLYYALDRTRVIMWVSLGGIFTNIVLSFLLIDKFQHVGLAAATGLTLCSNVVILMLGTRNLLFVTWKPFLTQSLLPVIGAIGALVAAHFLYQKFITFGEDGGLVLRSVDLLGEGVLFVLVWLIFQVLRERKPPIEAIKSFFKI